MKYEFPTSSMICIALAVVSLLTWLIIHEIFKYKMTRYEKEKNKDDLAVCRNLIKYRFWLGWVGVAAGFMAPVIGVLWPMQIMDTLPPKMKNEYWINMGETVLRKTSLLVVISLAWGYVNARLFADDKVKLKNT